MFICYISKILADTSKNTFDEDDCKMRLSPKCEKVTLEFRSYQLIISQE